MKRATIVFVRHGQTDQNVAMQAGAAVHEDDVPLNQTGIQQAQQVRDELASYSFDAIISSPLMRARRTAEIINERQRLPIIIDPELRERSVGGVAGDDWHAMFDMERNLPPKNPQHGGEDVKTFFTRVYDCIDRLITDYDGQTILVVAHGGVSHAFYAYARQLPWRGNMRIPPMGNGEAKVYDMVMLDRTVVS